MPRYRDASAAWHSACVPTPSRLGARPVMRGARCCALWQLAKGRKKRWGSLSEATAPVRTASYFFFAFLAFLAAFFAFLAIVPPEGVQLVPDGDSGSGALSHGFILSASQAVV